MKSLASARIVEVAEVPPFCVDKRDDVVAVVEEEEEREADVEFPIATKEEGEDDKAKKVVDDRKGVAVVAVVLIVFDKIEDGDVNSLRATKDCPADMHSTSCARKVVVVVLECVMVWKETVAAAAASNSVVVPLVCCIVSADD